MGRDRRSHNREVRGVMNELEIKLDGIYGTVLLNGQEVQVKELRIDWQAGSLPEITLTGHLRHLEQVIKGVPEAQLKFVVYCRDPVTLARHAVQAVEVAADRLTHPFEMKKEPTCLCFSSPVADCPVQEHAARARGNP